MPRLYGLRIFFYLHVICRRDPFPWTDFLRPFFLSTRMSPPRSDAPRQPPLPPPGLNYPQQRHQPHPLQPIQNPHALQHRAAHSQQPLVIGEAEAVAALAAIEERKEQERAQRQLKEDEELARRLAAQVSLLLILNLLILFPFLLLYVSLFLLPLPPDLLLFFLSFSLLSVCPSPFSLQLIPQPKENA